MLGRFINTLIWLFTSAPLEINRAAVAVCPSLQASLRGVSPQSSCRNKCMGIYMLLRQITENMLHYLADQPQLRIPGEAA